MAVQDDQWQDVHASDMDGTPGGGNTAMRCSRSSWTRKGVEPLVFLVHGCMGG